MDRLVIRPAGLQETRSPLSPAIRSGDLVFVSGQIAIDAHSSKLVEGDTAVQTRKVLENLKDVLEAAGASLDNVVKTTVYLTDIREFDAFNRVYSEFFTSEPPARSTVEVSRLVGERTVEIDAIARVEQPVHAG